MSGLLCPLQGSKEADSNLEARDPVRVDEIGLYRGDPDVNMAMVEAGVVPKVDPLVGLNGTAMYCHLTPMKLLDVFVRIFKPYHPHNGDSLS